MGGEQRASRVGQSSLERIQDLDRQLSEIAWPLQRLKQPGLLAERKKLLCKARLDVKSLESRIATLNRRIAESASWFVVRCSSQDKLLSAERRHLNDQLEELVQGLEDIGVGPDEDELPEAEVAAVMQSLEAVPQGSTIWNTIVDLVNRRSTRHTGHYGYRMTVKHLWRVASKSCLNELEAIAAPLGRPTQLFHGTSVENAAKIVKNGFQVPRRHLHGGMFGKGIYFAETPLKSVNYARREGWLSRAAGWLFSEKKSAGGLQMLLCDVYLGRSRTLRFGGAWPYFNPEKDLKAGFFSRSLGLGDYNSLTVQGGLFGAVWVTEYIVYEHFQALPRYLIEFERTRK